MKVVILAGGLGTRISEESHLRPKPMIEIGGRPILWHIMKGFSHYGFNDFVICLGYKGYVVKEYFAHYMLHESDVTFDFTGGANTIIHQHAAEPWRVTLVGTGVDTMTGGRLKRAAPYLDRGPFMLTYGDGVSDINIRDLVAFHHAHGKEATVTAVQPSGRFGALTINDSSLVSGFFEKPKGDGSWVNGGFFVFQPEVLERIDGDASVLEKEPLESMAADGELMAYAHGGFWQAMDTMRDRYTLEEHWKTGRAPWNVWD
ncbi:Glucose-1-phosphate cytidylyltransferase [Paenibacillus plantiphilus]|uniref:Glucose-1-phosphate cytidylyltransferase n=1 Tax=Paenibacillus plantiphilus TaxID=2905650 RepID=A0ABN8GUG8_9BACL|nr:glucose-1-phosphate cytidylyltransferase [Paenibacillus plantiphilus]CAH1218377.1 Glucose-1-phosphate cytidylyltransferase [Paenibacillus plantiphilus]